ncbi:hypothetical protein [Longimicrobium sp.]
MRGVAGTLTVRGIAFEPGVVAEVLLRGDDYGNFIDEIRLERLCPSN